MKTVLDVPRVTVPGLAEPEQIEAVQAILQEAQEHAEHIAEQKAGLVFAMIRLRKAPGQRTPKKAPRPTRHVLLKRRIAARSAFLAS